MIIMSNHDALLNLILCKLYYLYDSLCYVFLIVLITRYTHTLLLRLLPIAPVVVYCLIRQSFFFKKKRDSTTVFRVR